jgi:hypothetical protein
MVQTETDQVRLEQQATQIQEAFSAVFPASRDSGGLRLLARVWALARPLSRAYGIAVNPVALDPDKLREFIESARQAATHDPSLVDRTMSSRTFASLLRTESVTSLVKKHFSEAEQAALEKTYRG